MTELLHFIKHMLKSEHKPERDFLFLLKRTQNLPRKTKKPPQNYNQKQIIIIIIIIIIITIITTTIVIMIIILIQAQFNFVKYMYY